MGIASEHQALSLHVHTFQEMPDLHASKHGGQSYGTQVAQLPQLPGMNKRIICHFFVAPFLP